MIDHKKHKRTGLMNVSGKKLCFAASSGGHLEQLLQLKPLMVKYDSFLLTEKTDIKLEIEGMKQYQLTQVNRKEMLFPLKLIKNSLHSFIILLKEKPDAIITTGALAVIPACLITKLFKKKIIFIESFAKITDGTKTGLFIYRFADRFYVQWPSMARIYPNSIYIGGIY